MVKIKVCATFKLHISSTGNLLGNLPPQIQFTPTRVEL